MLQREIDPAIRADIEKFEEALKAIGVDTLPLTYIRRYAPPPCIPESNIH